jgi:ribulose bisphosphate carboxylase small subunit
MIFKYKVTSNNAHYADVVLFVGKDADHLQRSGQMTLTTEEWEKFKVLLERGYHIGVEVVFEP